MSQRSTIQTQPHAQGQTAENEPPITPGGPAPSVTITINGQAHEITRGRHSVAELKRIGGIPECDELAEIKGGRLVPLPDDGATHIEGQEQFVSNPRSGCAS